MNVVKHVKVRFTEVGFHCWPEAPKANYYLSFTHRHVFHFQVEAKVSHGDREIEFHSLIEQTKRALQDMYTQTIGGDRAFIFSSQSCEMIGENLMEELHARSIPVTAIEVWEDGECGARVEVAPFTIKPEYDNPWNAKDLETHGPPLTPGDIRKAADTLIKLDYQKQSEITAASLGSEQIKHRETSPWSCACHHPREAHGHFGCMVTSLTAPFCLCRTKSTDDYNDDVIDALNNELRASVHDEGDIPF